MKNYRIASHKGELECWHSTVAADSPAAAIVASCLNDEIEEDHDGNPIDDEDRMRFVLDHDDLDSTTLTVEHPLYHHSAGYTVTATELR